MTKVDYQTVDVPMRGDRIEIDLTVSMFNQEGWRPVTLISPDSSYPHYSILFERVREEVEHA